MIRQDSNDVCSETVCPEGTLRLRLLQGTDLLDGLVVKENESYSYRHIYINVSILDDMNGLLRSLSSCMLPYSGGSIDFNEEEFEFDAVFPTYAVEVAVYAMASANKKTVDKCSGRLIIPLSRLEENAAVLQWYQLNPDTSILECIKSAIKFEVCFLHTPQLSSIPVSPNPVSSLYVCTQEPSHELEDGIILHTIDTNTGLDSFVIQDVEYDSDESSPRSAPSDRSRRYPGSHAVQCPSTVTPKHVRLDDQPQSNAKRNWDSEEHCLPTRMTSYPYTTPGRSSNSSVLRTESAGALLGPRDQQTPIRDSGQSRPKRTFSSSYRSLPSTGKTGMSSPNRGVPEEDSLHGGLVDYFLIIGPSSIPRDSDDCQPCTPPCSPTRATFSTRESAAFGSFESDSIMDSKFHWSPSHEGEVDNSAHSDGGESGTESPSPEGESFSSICIWDKYPLVDHPGADHMPDKLEWFAFPEGQKVVDSPVRPKLEQSSFVLQSGDEAQWYGVCLTFYLRGCAVEIETTRPRCDSEWKEWGLGNTEESQQCGGNGNGRSRSDTDVPEETGVCWRWVGICMCLLTRYPVIHELSACLSVIYHSHIHPLLLHGEAHSVGFPTSALLLQLEPWMSALCFDAPSPISGILDVHVKLPLPSNLDLDSQYSNGNKSNETVVKFHFDSITSLPTCPHSLESALRFVGARTLLDIVYHALAEHKILLCSSDVSRLPVIAESLKVLLYPFLWCSAYVPVVPALLLDLIEAPVPYILGLPVKLLDKISPLVLKSVVVVNCDIGEIVSAPPCIRFPCDLDRWCMMAFKSTLEEGNIKEAGRCVDGTTDIHLQETNVYDRKEFNNIIQTIMFDCMLCIFSWVPDCVFNVGSGYPIFNRNMFLDGYCPFEARPLAEVVTDTQSFQRMISSIQLPQFVLFVNCARRMKYGYGYGTCTEAVSNSSTEMYPLEDKRYGLDLEQILPLGELCNPRRMLQPPYVVVENDRLGSHFDRLLPQWICSETRISKFSARNAVKSILDRYRFAVVEECSLNIELELPPTYDSTPSSSLEDGYSMSRSRSFRDVVFPPMKFESIHTPQSRDRKRRRKWTMESVEAVLRSQRAEHLVSENGCTICDDDTFELNLSKLQSAYQQHSQLRRKTNAELLKISKKLHAEYMFGEDVVMRLVLRILPLYSTENVELDLASSLQQVSDSFTQGAARRSLVAVLLEYCEQISVQGRRKVSPRNSGKSSSKLQFACEKSPVELHVTAFGYILRLSKLLLQACSVNKDFLTAHGLLEVSGYYYHVLFSANGDDRLDKTCYIQTLRSRLCHHAVYQNMTLWRTVINNALASHYMVKSTRRKTRHTPAIIPLRPILIHMCASDISADKIEHIMESVARDFSISNDEHEEIRDHIKKIWNIHKLYGCHKGNVLDGTCDDQKSIRYMLHGGTPMRKQPLSPWLVSNSRSSSPLLGRLKSSLSESKGDLASSEVDSDTDVATRSPSVTAQELSRRLNALHEEIDTSRHSEESSDRLCRKSYDVDSSNVIVDIFSRNVAFNPSHVDSACSHDAAVTAMDLSGHYLVSGDAEGCVNVVDTETGLKTASVKHSASINGVKYLDCGLVISCCSAGVMKVSRSPEWIRRNTTFGNSILSPYRKSIIATHRPFTTAITAVAVGVPHISRNLTLSSRVAVWGQNPDDWQLRESSQDVLEDKWCCVVGGASGGVKIYQGSTDASYNSGGSEILSTSVPDRGGVSALCLLSSKLNVKAQSGMHHAIGSTQVGDTLPFCLMQPQQPATLWSPMLPSDINVSGSLFLGTAKGGLVVYDLHSKNCLFKSGYDDGHRALVSSLLPVRSHEVITGGFDKLVKLWDIRSEYESIQLTGSAAAISSVTVDDYNDHNVIASCADHKIRMWDTRFPQPDRPYMTLEGHSKRVCSMVQQCGVLVTGSYDGTLRSWNISTGKCLQVLGTEGDGPLSCVALSAVSGTLNGADLVSVNNMDTMQADNCGDSFSLPNLDSIWLACGGWEGGVRTWRGKEH